MLEMLKVFLDAAQIVLDVAIIALLCGMTKESNDEE